MHIRIGLLEWLKTLSNDVSRRFYENVEASVGWGRWVRTTASRSRAVRPTTRRYPRVWSLEDAGTLTFDMSGYG